MMSSNSVRKDFPDMRFVEFLADDIADNKLSGRGNASLLHVTN